jgi:hypothetical protein
MRQVLRFVRSQPDDERLADLPAGSPPFRRGAAVDLALAIEHRINPAQGLRRQHEAVIDPAEVFRSSELAQVVRVLLRAQ